MGSAITWQDAKDAAEERELYGRQGYLATITSSEENDFILDKVLGLGWLGARDLNRDLDNGSAVAGNVEDGDWRWVTGPESEADGGNGLPFYTGYGSNGENVACEGSDVAYKMECVDGHRFENWSDGEPNNSGNEYVMHIFGPDGFPWNPGSGEGEWNDYDPKNTGVHAYIAEYGESPDDDVKNIQATDQKTVTIDAAPEPDPVQTYQVAFKNNYSPDDDFQGRSGAPAGECDGLRNRTRNI